MKNNKISIFLLGIFFYCLVSDYVLASNEENGGCIHEECSVDIISNMGHRHNTTAEILEAVGNLFGSIALACSKIDWSKCTCCSRAKYEESENVELPSLKKRSIDIMNCEEDKNEEESEEEEISVKEGSGFIDMI